MFTINRFLDFSFLLYNRFFGFYIIVLSIDILTGVWYLYNECVNLFYKKGIKAVFEYKINVWERLKEKGYTQKVLMEKYKLSAGTLDMLRKQKMIGLNVLDTLCTILKCQPNAIIRHIPDDETTGK